MKAREIIFEMPRLIASGDLDFAKRLDNTGSNRTCVEKFLMLDPEAVKTDKYGTLYVKETLNGGVYLYVSFETGIASYYMNYETMDRETLGHCATQVAVWASLARGMINITAYTFFDIMLKKFDTMVSDNAQSEDGRRFWIRRMIDALEKNLTVGIIDHDEIKVFDKNANFQEWLAGLDAWGKTSDHQNRLFFISNKKL